MKIRLSNEYRIEDLDDYNVVLINTYVSYGSGKGVSDTPKLIEKNLGYYRTVGQALEGYVKRINQEGTEDFDGNIDEYIKRIKDIEADAVAKMLKGIKG